MSISPISGGSIERRPLSVPSPSGQAVAKVDTDPGNAQGTSLPSVDIGTGDATIKIRYAMRGHSVEASAAGKNAVVPVEPHSLGIKFDKIA